MQMNIGAVITARRREMGLSQAELALRLRQQGIQVSNQAVSKWENGLTLPNALQFIQLCRVLQIRDVLSAFSQEGGRLGIDLLNAEGRKKLNEYIDLLLASGRYSAHGSDSTGQIRMLPLYTLAASAGTGQFLDSSDYDMIAVGSEVPMSANFGVRLAGDSMEPRYVNGQIVWVHQQPTLNEDEVGIFLLGGNAYCKKLGRRGGQLCLISLNPAYPPIPVEEGAELRVFGRVVG